VISVVHLDLSPEQKSRKRRTSGRFDAQSMRGAGDEKGASQLGI